MAKISRRLVVALAMNLARFPDPVLDDAEVSDALSAAIRAARDAFHHHVTDEELELVRNEYAMMRQ